MNCSEAERLFDAYLDRELNGSLRFEFDAHRLHCPICQRKLAMMEACEHILVGDSRGPALSDDFTARVMGDISIRSEQIRRTRYLKLFVGGMVAMQAAAAVAFAIIWNFGQDRNVRPPRLDTPVVRHVDPSELDVAMGDRSGVLLEDLIYKAIEKVPGDVNGLSRYAANLSVPKSLADAGSWNPIGWLFGGVNSDDDDASSDAVSDPFKL